MLTFQLSSGQLCRTIWVPEVSSDQPRLVLGLQHSQVFLQQPSAPSLPSLPQVMIPNTVLINIWNPKLCLRACFPKKPTCNDWYQEQSVKAGYQVGFWSQVLHLPAMKTTSLVVTRVQVFPGTIVKTFTDDETGMMSVEVNALAGVVNHAFEKYGGKNNYKGNESGWG